MRPHECGDGVGALIGHEAEADFGHRHGGEHGLGPLTGVAAQHAVHFAGRPCPQPFERRVSRLTTQCGDADLVHELVVAEWQFAHLREDRVGERTHLVVEARNGDAPAGIVHAGENARERHGRIDHRAAVHAGVQIAIGPAHVDLEVRHPAQRRQDTGNPRGEHGGVGDHDGITGKPHLLALEELLEVLAADFLLAFGQHDHVHRQRAAHGEVRLERLEVQIQLSLVVDRSTRIDAPVAHGGLERGRGPQLEGFGRLHVVVSVDQQRGRLGASVAPFTDHDGMSRRGLDRGGEPDSGERVGDELRRRGAVGCVLGARAHAGNAQKREQFLLRARIVGGAPGGEIGGTRGSSHEWCSVCAWMAATGRHG